MAKMKIDEYNKKIEQLRQQGYTEDVINQISTYAQSNGLVENPDTLPVRLAKGLIKPAVDYASLVGEAGYQTALSMGGDRSRLNSLTKKMESGKATESELNEIQTLGRQLSQPSPLRSKSVQTFENKLENQALPQRLGTGLGYGTKKGVGMASYFIPAGTTGKTALSLGALSGGARSFGDTEFEGAEQTIAETLAGGAGGALFGAGTYALGKGIGALKQLGKGEQKLGENLSKTAFKKQYGVPNKKYGGMGLVDDQKAFGVDVRSPEAMKESAMQLLGKSKSEIQSTVGALKDKKMDSFIKVIKNEIKNKMKTESALSKSYYQNLLDLIDADLPKGSNFLDFFNAKVNYGPYTKAGFTGGAEEGSKAEAYNFLYGKMSDVVGKVIDKSGQESLKNANKAFSTSMRTLDWLDDLARSGKNVGTGINFKDMVTAGLAYTATGTPISAMAAPIAARYLTGAGGTKMAGQAFNTLGKATERLGQGIPAMAQPAVQNIGQPLMRQVGSMAFSGNVPEKQAMSGTVPVDSKQIEQEFSNQNLMGGQQNTDMYKPLSYMEAIQLKQSGQDISNRFIISPKGNEMYNPMTKSFVPYVAPKDEKGGFASISPKLDQLLAMHSNLPATGAIGGRATNLARSVGNVSAAAYESASSSLAVELAAAMGLKPLSEAEVAEVRKKWLPSPTDTPAQAKAKIATLKTLLTTGQGL